MLDKTRLRTLPSLTEIIGSNPFKNRDKSILSLFLLYLRFNYYICHSTREWGRAYILSIRNRFYSENPIISVRMVLYNRCPTWILFSC